ncbi:MAG: GGDEF domain-containing protein [Alphaproteobacteria bacterium]
MDDIIASVMDRRLYEFYGRWRECRARSGTPCDTGGIVSFFAPFADNMLVVEIENVYYTYRHYGRTFVEKFDVDLSNQTIEHVPFSILPRERLHILEFEYSYVHGTGRPVWRRYTGEIHGEEKTWQRLTLPVAPNLLVVGVFEVPQQAEQGQDGAARLLTKVLDSVPIHLDEAGGIGGLAISLSELAQSRIREAELQYLATVDPLTGLSNRRRLMEVGDEEVSRSTRYEQPLSLLMLDIDHFKRINDSHGHAAGDEALRQFAAACREVLRRNDTIGRCGGEEFAVLLPNSDIDGAAALAERLRRRVAGIEVPHGEICFGFTVSIGVATLAPGDTGLETLMARADQALYQAKTHGRNRVMLADVQETVSDTAVGGLASS